MSEVKPQDILLRVSPKMLERYQSLVVMGAGRGRVAPVPYAFSRADISTCATWIDRNGVLHTAAAGIPRIELVDLDGDGIRETPGVLLESGRTNALTRSEELDNGAWGLSGATVSANGLTAPDGTASADALIENAANSAHEFFRATPALTNNTRSIFSFWVHAASRDWCGIRTDDKAGTIRRTWFNARTGVLGTKDGGHDAFVMGAGQDISGSRWRRFGVSFDAASGGAAPQVDGFLASGDGVVTYQGDGASGMYFWGMQFETDQPFPSSYIKTVSSTVARAADSLTVPFNFGPMDMTTLVRVARPAHADAGGATLGVSPRMFEMGSPQPTIRAFFNSTARQLFSQVDTTGTDTSTAALAIPAGAELAYLTQWKNFGTGGQVAHDGGSGLSSFSSAASAISFYGNQTLYVGRAEFGTSEDLYGNLIDLIIARGLFSRAEMLAIP